MGKNLIIKGADFSKNGILVPPDYILKNGVSISEDMSGHNEARANVVILRDEAHNPFQWGEGEKILVDYSFIEIPAGATAVKVTVTNPNYYFGIVNRTQDGTHSKDSGWKAGGNSYQQTIGSDEVYITSTLKIGSAGTDAFTDETIESVGWSIEFFF